MRSIRLLWGSSGSWWGRHWHWQGLLLGCGWSGADLDMRLFFPCPVLFVGTPSPKRILNECVPTLPHKLRKGLCLTPKQLFRLMRQGPFLLCLCRRGAFTAFLMIFHFRCSFEPEAESRVWPLVHKWNKPSPTAGKPGRMILSAHPDTPGQTDKTILPYRWFARFHATGYVLFFVVDFLFHGFLFWSFLSNLPLLPFTSIFASFSEPHQTVIFVLGANVIPGFDWKARSSTKPPVFGKNLQPVG